MPFQEIKIFRDEFVEKCSKLDTTQVSDLDKLYHDILKEKSKLLGRKFNLDVSFGHVEYLKKAFYTEYLEKKDSIKRKVELLKETTISDCIEKLMNMLKSEQADFGQTKQTVIPNIDEIVPPPTKYDEEDKTDVETKVLDIKVMQIVKCRQYLIIQT